VAEVTSYVTITCQTLVRAVAEHPTVRKERKVMLVNQDIDRGYQTGHQHQHLTLKTTQLPTIYSTTAHMGTAGQYIH